MQSVATSEAPAAIGPYSQAISAGNMVFTSGQIALRPDGSLVEGEIQDQANQVLQNLDAVLKAAGVGRKNVVKATIFMTDLAKFSVVNEIYGTYFGDHRPARSTVQVAALPKGVQIEIEFVAVREA